MRFRTDWVPQHSKNPRRAVSRWTEGSHSVSWEDSFNSSNLGPEDMKVLGELQVSFPDGKLRKLLSGKESAGQQIRKTQKGKGRPGQWKVPGTSLWNLLSIGGCQKVPPMIRWVFQQQPKQWAHFFGDYPYSGGFNLWPADINTTHMSLEPRQ